MASSIPNPADQVSIFRDLSFNEFEFDFQKGDLLRTVELFISECRRITCSIDILVQNTRARITQLQSIMGVPVQLLEARDNGMTHKQRDNLISFNKTLINSFIELADAARKLGMMDIKKRYNDLFDRLESARFDVVFEHRYFHKSDSWFLTDTGSPLYLREHQLTMKICQDSISMHSRAFVTACIGLKGLADHLRRTIPKIQWVCGQTVLLVEKEDGP
ncbi:hypothetical protein H072_6796 [Dactylellina haptotyla CBS 200.50]|uniref:Uncharacterized protein n=1 Tax=Dactylellina haptotyla (strain CBS 200.50) TaxID=1284197 RepID=S8BVT1_DACHA|nr:hypothetical protein H072_6796 [Dactylellina haptotyla CBS 200.50]